MAPNNLRSQVIRLAHTQPALRAHLLPLIASYGGNPSGESIYPVQVDHGYTEPLAGGTDVMRKLQNRFLTEQGREPRPESPRLATHKEG